MQEAFRGAGRRTATCIIAPLLLANFFSGCSGQPPDPTFHKLLRDDIHAMIIPAGTSSDVLPGLAKSYCDQRQSCWVIGWTEEASAPRAWPMTDLEVRSMAFSYNLHRPNGMEDINWDCRVFSGRLVKQCISPTG